MLAYSTVSQLGYMMLALGVGGWLAGMFHLFTHAFFKALLFLCSGSVIHACGTNEMPQMGGLRKKMPWTACTMLVGCLAIAGAGMPLLIGLSGYYSKDCIIAQALSFRHANPLLRLVLLGGRRRGGDDGLLHVPPVVHDLRRQAPRRARLSPRPRVAADRWTCRWWCWPLFAVVVGWNVPGTHFGLEPLLGAGPAGWALPTGPRPAGCRRSVHHPAEHASHEDEHPRSRRRCAAFASALAGFLLATRVLRPAEARPGRRRRSSSRRIYRFLVHKWWFDELYRPALRPAGAAVSPAGWPRCDKQGIDWLADGLARLVGRRGHAWTTGSTAFSSTAW